jgi:predicted SprT family Zn-dependent metalloprotease
MAKDQSDILASLQSLDLKYGWSTIFCIDDVVNEQLNPKPKPRTIINTKNVNHNTPLLTTPPKSKFPRQKYDLTKQYFIELNQLAFDNKLPSDMAVTWSKRLTKTAGFTRLKRPALSAGARTASIELSEKVLDDEHRLKQTLGHEMCHAAAWLIDGVCKPPHGETFWKWARRLESSVSGMSVTTCHSYDINTPFKFMCTNDSCCKVYSRHSKKGIDVNK